MTEVCHLLVGIAATLTRCMTERRQTSGIKAVIATAAVRCDQAYVKTHAVRVSEETVKDDTAGIFGAKSGHEI